MPENSAALKNVSQLKKNVYNKDCSKILLLYFWWCPDFYKLSCAF